MRDLLGLFPLLVMASTAHAQVRDEDECPRLQPSITSFIEIVTCTFDLPGSEQALSQSVNRHRAQLPAERRNALNEAQRAWSRRSDAQCWKGAEGPVGSTMHSSSVIACTADMNRERARYLGSR